MERGGNDYDDEPKRGHELFCFVLQILCSSLALRLVLMPLVRIVL